jgi:hypothetical protein
MHVNAAVLILVAALAGTACSRDARTPVANPPLLPTNPKDVVLLLEDRLRRDAAACRLLELSRYRTKPRYTERGCSNVEDAVNHVITAPQDDGSSIYVVFMKAEHPSDEAGLGKPKGPFFLIDSEGYILPVFGAANYLDKDDAVFAYAGDTRLAVAHVIRHGGDRNSSAQVLHIVPVTPSQQSALSVVVGPPTLESESTCLGFYWKWQRRDLDGDGIPEIEIGPKQNKADGVLPRAVYRWSKDTQRYDGPNGSAENGYLRVDTSPHEGACCPYSKAIAQFVLDRRQLPRPTDLEEAVRTDDCLHGELKIIEH